MIGAASDLYVNTCTVAVRSGRDTEWGEATYAAAVPVDCLIIEQTKIVRAPDGSEQISGTQVYAGLDAGGLLQPGALVTLDAQPWRPGGSTTTVITLDVINVGDPAVDGVVANCE